VQTGGKNVVINDLLRQYKENQKVIEKQLEHM
jgi:hypothetical protein